MTEPAPESRVIYANVAYDPLIWVEIPVLWSPEFFVGPDAWAEQVAAEWWADLDHSADDEARLTKVLTMWAEKVGGAVADLSIDLVNYLYLPHPSADPLLVRVWVDDEPGLTAAEAAEVDDPESVEPPLVEDFPNEHLATGLRVLRYRPFDPGPGASPEPGALYAVLRYAFEVPDHDVVIAVTTSCSDLGHLIKAMDGIDAFVRGIRWAYEPLDLVTP